MSSNKTTQFEGTMRFGLTHFIVTNTLLVRVVLLSGGQLENFGTRNEILCSKSLVREPRSSTDKKRLAYFRNLTVIKPILKAGFCGRLRVDFPSHIWT